MELGRALIGLGLVFLLVGFCLKIAVHLPLGRLPGDFRWQLGGITLYFPLVSCLMLSFVLSVALATFKYFGGK